MILWTTPLSFRKFSNAFSPTGPSPGAVFSPLDCHPSLSIVFGIPLTTICESPASLPFGVPLFRLARPPFFPEIILFQDMTSDAQHFLAVPSASRLRVTRTVIATAFPISPLPLLPVLPRCCSLCCCALYRMQSLSVSFLLAAPSSFRPLRFPCESLTFMSSLLFFPMRRPLN